ncbi:MAG: exo-alpha-sialidase [Sedimentisphaerales bacterium]|nr:exo-alpha-sialidase [Sedimentisphaerales bacterium]
MILYSWKNVLLFFVSVSATLASTSPTGQSDPRNIRSGSIIYEHGYCDQPYVVLTKDGNWLCVFTTGSGHEGQSSQYIVATQSRDQGQTWSEPAEIESPAGPEASWAMPLITPSGRVYVFYDYNGDAIRTLNEKPIRADMLGWYCYKYSDDSGLTWSKRYRLPVRVTACDRSNDWQGRVQLMWGIGKPIVFDGKMIFGFTKLGRYMLDQGEGWFFRSDNILFETNPDKIKWQMLPDGDHGLRRPVFGSVQEEQNLVWLGGERLYCIYRTTMGYPVHSYSQDGGHTWSTPEIATYTPCGKPIKHPRACPRIWRCQNGKFLFWFHNHGGKTYDDRNPVWISGGLLKKGKMYWSQPEILLYDENPKTRMSYPDLIEQDGHYYITETQKSVARIHEIDASLLEGVWTQELKSSDPVEGCVLSIHPQKGSPSENIQMPTLPESKERQGFSIEMQLQLSNFKAGQILLDSTARSDNGIRIQTTEKKTVEIVLQSGRQQTRWDCDPEVLTTSKEHHIVITVDGGPKIIMFLIDGLLCDGGMYRQFGWGRCKSQQMNLDPVNPLFLASGKTLKRLRLYNRPLRTSEAVRLYHQSQ